MNKTPRRLGSTEDRSGRITPRRVPGHDDSSTPKIGGNFGGSVDGSHPFSFHVSSVNFDDRKLQFEKRLVQSSQDAMRRHPPKAGVTLSAIRRGYIPTPATSIFGGLMRTRRATLITTHIAIGAREDAGDHQALKELGVTHIVNLTSVVPCHFPDAFVYLHIPIQDQEDVNITLELPAVAAFLKHVETIGGRALVHCIVGVSRSVTLVAMYLMTVHNIRLKHVYDALEALRPIINPNEGFKLQLAKLEVREFGGSSVTQVSRYRSGTNAAWDFYGLNNIKASFPVWNDQDSQPPGASGTKIGTEWALTSGNRSMESDGGNGKSPVSARDKPQVPRDGRRRNSHSVLDPRLKDLGESMALSHSPKDGRRRHSHGLVLPPVATEFQMCVTEGSRHRRIAVAPPGAGGSSSEATPRLDTSRSNHTGRVYEDNSLALTGRQERATRDCCVCS